MQKLSLIDFAFLLTDSDESPKHVASLMILKKPKGARKNYAAKLVDECKSLDQPSEPFNLIIEMLGVKGPHWTAAHAFDINEHIIFHETDTILSIKELREFASKLHATKLLRDKPMWECHIIDRVEGGKMAFYFKIHHAYADGVSLVSWINECFPKESSKFISPIWTHDTESKKMLSTPKFNPFRSLLSKAKENVESSLGFAKLTSQMMLEYAGITHNATSVPYRASGDSSLTGQVSPGRQFETASLLMSDVLQLSKKTKSTVNHIALTCIDHALHQYLRDINEPIDKKISIQMPVNLRSKNTNETGNQLGIMVVELASPEKDIQNRMIDIGYSLRNVKNQIQNVNSTAVVQYSILAATLGEISEKLKLNNTLPPQANVVVSNLPGPRKLRYFKDAQILKMYPVSTLAPGIRINITLLSYVAHLDIGIVATRDLSELHLLSKYIEQAFVELQQTLF